MEIIWNFQKIHKKNTKSIWPLAQIYIFSPFWPIVFAFLYSVYTFFFFLLFAFITALYPECFSVYDLTFLKKPVSFFNRIFFFLGLSEVSLWLDSRYAFPVRILSVLFCPSQGTSRDTCCRSAFTGNVNFDHLVKCVWFPHWRVTIFLHYD